MGILAAAVTAVVAVLAYLRRDKPPKVEDNSQTVIAGDGSQVNQAGRDLVFQVPVADASPEPPASSITIKLKAKGHSDQGWGYGLEVFLRNLSERTFEVYRVEIEVPHFLLPPRTTSPTEVRRTQTHTLFRTLMTGRNMPAVFPEDSRRVWKIGVYTDDMLEDSEETIAATLYVNDQRACKEELQIRDLFA